jgi:S-adenosylmethionine decarboxylase
MHEVARRCRFDVRSETFVQFEPLGATGVLVLAESHFSAHTFHEEECVRVDCYCCGDTFNPLECMAVIEEVFGARKTCDWRVIER